MDENKRRLLFVSKTKRLDTIKKKARELSILCNVDVCLVGTHQNDDDDVGSSHASTWQTWPEDQDEVARILEKYKKKVEEKDHLLSPKKTNNNKRAVWEFDVDKALEGMSDEELKRVLEQVDQMEGDVDNKLCSLFSNHDSGMHATPMTEGLPSDQTMEEANSDKFDSGSTHSTSPNTDLALNQTMKQARPEELNSEVEKKGLKLFGVYMIPAMESLNQY